MTDAMQRGARLVGLVISLGWIISTASGQFPNLTAPSTVLLAAFHGGCVLSHAAFLIRGGK